ncbi:hypothetical protein M5K25_007635 [Dendrobium thyrsiflorum]|uniref:Uncharacterized protein n=1 Tax=Dendrobium thyrsiflorum TaxID=117978 RepID=A0ABD0VFP1_DENTH
MAACLLVPRLGQVFAYTLTYRAPKDNPLSWGVLFWNPIEDPEPEIDTLRGEQSGLMLAWSELPANILNTINRLICMQERWLYPKESRIFWSQGSSSGLFNMQMNMPNEARLQKQEAQLQWRNGEVGRWDGPREPSSVANGVDRRDKRRTDYRPAGGRSEVARERRGLRLLRMREAPGDRDGLEQSSAAAGGPVVGRKLGVDVGLRWRGRAETSCDVERTEDLPLDPDLLHFDKYEKVIGRFCWDNDVWNSLLSPLEGHLFQFL